MLTDAQVRKARPSERDQKLFDSGGLFLLISKAGHRTWRQKYRFGGKEKLLVHGPYPEIGLADARDMRDAARRLLREQVDPGVEKKKSRIAAHIAAGLSFEQKARAWHAAQRTRWSGHYAKLVLRALERDIFPDLGGLPLSAIDAPLIVSTLRKIEKRGAVETAKRIRQHLEGIFAYAIAEGVAASNPAAGVGLALAPIVSKGKQPALLQLSALQQLVAEVDGSSSRPGLKLASRLLALTAVRPGVVQGARWQEFEGIDWAAPSHQSVDPVWRVPASRMKQSLERKGEGAFEHLIPLPRQVVELLHQLRRLSGRGELLFPHQHHPRAAMSNNTLGVLYNRLGYRGRMVPHGWRAAFSTVMNNQAGKLGRPGDRAVIDLMLAHVPKGLSASEAAYNRAEHMERRREIAQEWADLLFDGVAAPSYLF